MNIFCTLLHAPQSCAQLGLGRLYLDHLHLDLGRYCAFSLLGLLLLLPQWLGAEQPQSHPIIDKPVAGYERSERLSELSFEQLLQLKGDYLKEVQTLNAKIAGSHQNDEYLISKLIAYDRQRMDIIAVIPKLIADYEIAPPFSETLLRYAQTFDNLDRQYEGKLKTLDDYRSYDFRVGMAYLSLMSTLQTAPELYQNLHADMEDASTTLGAYLQRLDTAYGEVEQASDSIEELNLIRHLEREIERIEQELNSRY